MRSCPGHDLFILAQVLVSISSIGLYLSIYLPSFSYNLNNNRLPSPTRPTLRRGVCARSPRSAKEISAPQQSGPKVLCASLRFVHVHRPERTLPLEVLPVLTPYL